MANVLFPALTIGVMALLLRPFHQMQRMACAAIAQRHARRKQHR